MKRSNILVIAYRGEYATAFELDFIPRDRIEYRAKAECATRSLRYAAHFTMPPRHNFTREEMQGTHDLAEIARVMRTHLKQMLGEAWDAGAACGRDSGGQRETDVDRILMTIRNVSEG